jgi:flagellar protein FliS
MALQLGVDREHAMAGALTEFYGAASKSVLASSLEFDAAGLEEIRKDFIEVRDGLAIT